MKQESKLPRVGTTIFTIMSALAGKHGAINLSQGFPDFAPDAALLELCSKKMKDGPHQYAPMAGSRMLREVIAELIEKKYHLAFNPETEITITAGATQAIFTAITALVHPGDEVIYLEPAYDCYEPALLLQHAKPVPIRLKNTDFRPDWNTLKARLNGKTRMIILNNPHNPCSSVLLPEDLDELEEILKNFPQLLILSDEVYEHICFIEQGHQSVWKMNFAKDRCIQVCSFGKTLHATGWKIGYCVCHESLMKEIRKVHQFNVFCVNHPLQEAIAEYLRTHPGFYRIENMYRKKRDFFVDKMQKVPLQFFPCSGSYFLLADYSAISSMPDRDFCIKMTQEAGVASIPLSAFYHDGRDERKIRFCFAKKESTLEEAAEKINSWIKQIL